MESKVQYILEAVKQRVPDFQFTVFVSDKIWVVTHVVGGIDGKPKISLTASSVDLLIYEFALEIEKEYVKKFGILLPHARMGMMFKDLKSGEIGTNWVMRLNDEVERNSYTSGPIVYELNTDLLAKEGKYKYTVSFQYKSNIVRIESDVYTIEAMAKLSAAFNALDGLDKKRKEEECK